MENLIFMKTQILNNDNVRFIMDVYETSKRDDKLILHYNSDLLFIENDFNKIKKLLKNILTTTIDEYNEYLYKIGFYNKEKYNRGNNRFKLLFFEICVSNENNNTTYMLDNESYSMMNYIFCLEDLNITFFKKRYEYKAGDLIMFPCGWAFYYKIKDGKRYVLGKLFS
jgi:hypothetical protein